MAKAYTIPSIFTAVDKFSGPMKRMAQNSDSVFARVERNVRKVGDASFRLAKKSLMVGTALAIPMIAAGNEAVAFEAKMSNVATLIDTNIESMEDMSNKVLNLATKLPVSIDDLTSSLYDIRSAGIPANKALATLEVSAKLSKAGLSTTAEATNILTSSLNTFASEGLSAQQQADILFKTVKNGKTTLSEMSQAFGANAPIIQSAGVKLADFSAATAALTTTGTPASQAQNSLRASVIALQKPTVEMTKIYKKLGVASGSELITKYGSLGAAYDAINAKSKQLKLNNGKVWGSTEALSAVTSLTGATNAAYVKTLDDMVNGSNAVDDAYKKQSKTAQSNMQIVKNNLQAVAIQLGTALLPVVTDLAKAILPVVQSFAAWIKKNPALVSQIARLAVKAVLFAGAISAGAFAIGLITKAFAIAKGVQQAYNVVMGITYAFSKGFPIAMKANVTALKSFTAASKVSMLAQKAFNLVMSMNPYALAAVAVVALGAAIYGLATAQGKATSAEGLANQVRERALDNTRDQRAEVAVLFATLRNVKVGTDEYTATLKKIEEIQPGITSQYNLQAGALDNINRAERQLTKSIIERAKAEAEGELMKEKYKEAMELREKAPSVWKVAGGLTANPFNMVKGVKAARASQNADANALEREAGMLANRQGERAAQSARNSNGGFVSFKNIERSEQNQKLEIVVKTDGNAVSTALTGQGKMPKISTVN